jgi:hypothetical protein
MRHLLAAPSGTSTIEKENHSMIFKRYCIELELAVNDEDEAKDIVGGISDYVTLVPGVENVEANELTAE